MGTVITGKYKKNINLFQKRELSQDLMQKEPYWKCKQQSKFVQELLNIWNEIFRQFSLYVRYFNTPKVYCGIHLERFRLKTYTMESILVANLAYLKHVYIITML